MKFPQYIRRHVKLLVVVGVLLVLATVFVEAGRQGAGRKIQNGQADQYGFYSSCGKSRELAAKLGQCLEEIFQMVYGRFDDPTGDEDMVGHCGRFNRTERCIRGISKDCLTGLHKTSASAVASGAKRFRLNECKNAQTRGRYAEPLKCARRKGKEMENVLKNHTAIMQGIRDLPDVEPEDKLMKMCCTLNALDREIETRFDRECPKSTQAVLSIVHAMTDDAKSTLCVAPKCNHALDKVINHPYKPPQNLLEPIVQILFQIRTDQ